MAVGGVVRNGVAVAVAVGGRAGSEVEVDVATVIGPEVLVAVGKTVAEGRGLAVGALNGAHLSVTVFLSFDSLTVKDVGHVTLRLVFGSSKVASAKRVFLKGRVSLVNDQIHPNLPDRPEV